MFKKHTWIKYGRVGRKCRLEVIDEDGKILDKAEWLLSDKNSERQIFTIFKHKFGVFARDKSFNKSSLQKFNNS